jgi:hypothetical protein
MMRFGVDKWIEKDEGVKNPSKASQITWSEGKGSGGANARASTGRVMDKRSF